jgi:hypothetical protein
MRIGKPYNRGDEYENRLEKLMKKLGIMPKSFRRAGAGNGVDAVFIHEDKIYNLELKKDLLADYGQKALTWNEKYKWQWSVKDEVTDLYSGFGILDYINAKNIVPNKYSIPNDELTFDLKKDDQKKFEDNSQKIGGKALLDYYRLKNTFYIQVGTGYGFYSLSKDPANLGAPKFWTSFTLRLRAKTIHSDFPHQYAFYAVLKVKDKPKKSNMNIESNKTQKIPPIKP